MNRIHELLCIIVQMVKFHWLLMLYIIIIMKTFKDFLLTESINWAVKNKQPDYEIFTKGKWIMIAGNATLS